jgi:post-segregation antitoxin (ccd killing protein)
VGLIAMAVKTNFTVYLDEEMSSLAHEMGLNISRPVKMP